MSLVKFVKDIVSPQNKQKQITDRNKVLDDCANVMELAISSIKRKNILYDDGTAQLAYSTAINMIDAYVENKDEKIKELLEKLHKTNYASLLVSDKENVWSLDAYFRKEVSNGKSKEEVNEKIEKILEDKFLVEYGNPDRFDFAMEKRDVVTELSEMAKAIRTYKI